MIGGKNMYSVAVSVSKSRSTDYCTVYVSNGYYRICKHVSYNDAMRYLRMVEKHTGTVAILTVNPYSPYIGEKDISGFIGGKYENTL